MKREIEKVERWDAEDGNEIRAKTRLMYSTGAKKNANSLLCTSIVYLASELS